MSDSRALEARRKGGPFTKNNLPSTLDIKRRSMLSTRFGNGIDLVEPYIHK